jgi:hypothetical protein
MSLSKALKTKNRIAGELNKLQQIFNRENSRKEGSTSKIDRELLFNQVQTKRSDLIRIKRRITEANVGIAGTLVAMAELKAESAFLQSVNVTDGKSCEHRGFREAPIEAVFDAFLKQDDIDSKTAVITRAIDGLQDIADTFNATTIIEFEET